MDGGDFMFRALVCFVPAVLLTACGGGSGGLTRDQQQKFGDGIQNVGRLATVIRSTGQRFGGVETAGSGTGGRRDQDVEEMEAKIEKAVDKGLCKIPNAFPAIPTLSPDLRSSRPPEIANEVFSISGDECPLTASMTIQATGDSKSTGEVQVQFEYTLRDKELIDIVQVDSGKVTGKYFFQLEAGGGTPESEFLGATIYPFKMESRWSLNGSFHSVADGDVGFEMAMNCTNRAKSPLEFAGESSFSLTARFKDFVAELVATSKPTQDTAPGEFRLGSRKLSAEEFAALYPYNN